MCDWRYYFHRFRKRWFDRKVEECGLEAQRLQEELQALEDELAEAQRRFEAAIAAIREEEAAARREFEAAEAEACREDSWLDYNEEQDADALEYAKTYGPEVNQRLWKHCVAANKDQIADAYLYATIVRGTRSIDVVFEILRDHPKLKATVSIDTNRGQALAAIALGREHLYPKGKCLSKSKKRTLRRAVATWGRHTRSGGFSVGAETTSPADEAPAHLSPVDSASSTAEPSMIAAPASSKRSAACLLCEGLVTLVVVASSWLVYALACRLRKEGVGASKKTPAPDEAPSFAEAPSSEASALNTLDVESVDLEIKRPTGEIHRLSFRPTDRVEVVLCALADEIGCDARTLRLLEDGERIPEDTPVQSIGVELGEPLILVFEQRGGGPGASTASAESASPASSNEVTLNDLPSKDSLVEQLGGEERQVWKDYCLTRPPKDLKSGRYNRQSVRLAELYQPVYDLVSSLKDIHGEPLVACYLCLPYLLAVHAPIQGMAALNYCPKELESALQGEHSALARRSSGRLMSTTFEFVRLSCSSWFGLFAKIDMVSFEVDYGVEPSKFVSKEDYQKIMAAMRTFFLAAVAENILPLTMLLSKKTVTVFQKDILQMSDAEFAAFLAKDAVDVLQTADGKPHPFTHPEGLLKYFTNRHKTQCEEWDAGFDALFRRLNAPDRCTTATALHDNTQDHPAVQLAKERHAEACKIGGAQSKRQLLLAETAYEVHFDLSKLSPDWRREFAYWEVKFESEGRRGKLIGVLMCRLRGSLLTQLVAAIDRHEYDQVVEQYAGDKVELLQKLKGLVQGGDKMTLVTEVAAAFKHKAEEMKLGAADDAISDKVLAKLVQSPEWAAKYNRLFELYDDDKVELFRALKAMQKGNVQGLGKMKSLASLAAAFERQADEMKLDASDAISDEVLAKLLLSPEWTAEYNRLLLLYDNKKADLFRALDVQLGGRKNGVDKMTLVTEVATAFTRKAKEMKLSAADDVISDKVLAALSPDWTAKYNRLLESYDRKKADLFRAMKAKLDGREKGGFVNKVKAAEKEGSERMLEVRCSKLGCKCDNQATTWIGDKVDGAENLTNGQCVKGPRINSKHCSSTHSKWSLTGEDMKLDEFKTKHGLQEKEKKKAVRKSSKRKAAGGSVAGAGVSTERAGIPGHPTAPAVKRLKSLRGRAVRLVTVPALGGRVLMTFDCGRCYGGTIISVAELSFGNYSLALLLDDETVEHGVSFPADDIRLLKSCNGEPLGVNDSDYLSRWMGFDVNNTREIEEIDELRDVTASLFSQDDEDNDPLVY